MKTLVAARHSHGPAQNGDDGCFARWGEKGMCPGIKIAEWLNALGDDKDFYIKPTTHSPEGTTNGQVRDNWIRGSQHIVPANPALADLRARERQTAQELRTLRRTIRRVEREVRT